MIANIALAVAGLIAALLVYVALQPPAFRVARSALIEAPRAAVFQQVDDFHNWDHWSPWAKKDPNAKAEFFGAPSGEGAGFAWEGNREVGRGRMTIVESRPHDLIRIRLEFSAPMQATNEALFTFEPEGEATRVTWAMTGTNNIFGRLLCTFMSMDRMVGSEFQKGLASIKAIVERKA